MFYSLEAFTRVIYHHIFGPPISVIGFRKNEKSRRFVKTSELVCKEVILNRYTHATGYQTHEISMDLCDALELLETFFKTKRKCIIIILSSLSNNKIVCYFI